MHNHQEESFKDLDSVHAAAIADILDELGLRRQTLSPEIQPLAPDTRIFGRAMTVLATSTWTKPEDPYRKELEAVDALQAGDVFVATVLGPETCGFWGELLTTAALANGATGAVIDGHTRDSGAIREMDFPLFARGNSPLDSHGRSEVVRFGEPIECGGVRIETGDYLFGDSDGLVVIPAARVDEVIAAAAAKIGVEGEMRKALLGGMPVMDAYDKYGVL